jgi:hypothetical protein
MFRVIGIILLLLAVALISVPRFTDCESQGEAIKTAEGETVPMNCHWTGIAEIGVAIPMYIVGAVMTTSRRQKTLAFLSLLGVVLGGLAIAFPTKLIGVCQGPVPMLCATLMKPLLILLGGGVVAASALGLGLSMSKSISKESLASIFGRTKKVIACKGA